MTRIGKICLPILVFLGYLAWITVTTWPDSLTRVVFCDVGQGDATLITRGTTQVLIDGGPDDKVLECLSGNLPWWERQLELVVATHADADHITGLTSVLQSYEVASFLMTDQVKKTQEYQALLTQIRAESRMDIISPVVGKKLFLGPYTVAQIVWPNGPHDLSFVDFEDLAETQLSATPSLEGEETENYNDGSIVLYLTIGQTRLLLTGDLETAGENALVASGLTKQIDVLKAGHHGSKTSSSLSFLGQARPEFTVISCGLGNRFGHPAAEVLARLEEVGSRFLRTDQVGEITLISDGREYWFSF